MEPNFTVTGNEKVHIRIRFNFSEARKLLNTEKIDSSSKKVSSLFANLVLSALPKGRVPASSPSRKTHGATLDHEKLFARHLAGIDRILQSVPSPGIGH
ncbi:hypothetical protein CISIN_1g047704mg [Citrus sinensis]|uniref:Uncharacterized protein n=1 Tax=Citrus sinensis TaxID=2711 RepID=A0A067GRE4_CITSI|nr:hypothetical protein CISIN_1g047704mg [Citrus sinensis]